MSFGAWGTPQAVAERAERLAPLPSGVDERFVGYGFAALRFASGDVLGLRRWPASSIGRAYTSLWHRLANGTWRLYADVPPAYSCARYVGSAVEREVQTRIHLAWPSPYRLRVSVPEAAIEVEVRLRTTLATAAVAAACAALPTSAMADRRVNGWLAQLGRRVLREPELRLQFGMPNGQRVLIVPRRVWHIEDAVACWSGADLGRVVPTDSVRIGPTDLTVTRHFSYHMSYFSPASDEARQRGG